MNKEDVLERSRQEKLISAIICTGLAVVFAVSFVIAIYLYKVGM